jgi:N-sulfoglucosamine sulfohydrolase
MVKNPTMKITAFNLTYIFIGIIICTILSCKEKRESSYFPLKPNFIFIIADDMSWDDCGAYGNINIQTPNIDALAKQGMKFNQAFLATSSCSPSRASIITGMYPHKTDAEQLHWPLPADKITFVEKLKTAGYWTAQAGKWHMGDDIKDRFNLVNDAGTEGFQLSSSGKEAPPQGDGSGCELWLPTLRERPADKPFLLWLAAFDPHRPYQDSIIPTPHSLDAVFVPPYLPDNEVVRKELAQYYDEITRLDNYIGSILDELELQGISDNTIVFFISDNGRPFPREKTTLYDSGIKTPWIIKWPGVIKPGTESNSLVSAVDIAPTILHLAGLNPLTGTDGIDFSAILLNPVFEIRDFIFAESNWHDFEDYSRAIRTTEFKYIRNYYADLPNTPPADVVRSLTFRSMMELKNAGQLTSAQMSCFNAPRPEEELYDVKKDTFELYNLANDPSYADILVNYRDQLENIRLQTNDRLPDARTKDEFDRETGEPNKYRIRPRPSKAQMLGESIGH